MKLCFAVLSHLVSNQLHTDHQPLASHVADDVELVAQLGQLHEEVGADVARDFLTAVLVNRLRESRIDEIGL